MSLRLDNRRRVILLLLAVCALVMQLVLDMTRTPTRQWDYDLKLDAATRAERAFTAVRQHRGLEGASLDLVNDPAGTGLIGPEFSLITNAAGDLDAKLTSLNPNFAAVLVDYFRQAGLGPGDPVAVAVSGSFPGMNICVFAALEAMELKPVVITSVGASNWGANSPEFTWLDMESLFVEMEVFKTRSVAATFGGGNDMGRGLSPAGRELLRESIDRNGVLFLASENVEDAVARRMALYEEQSGKKPYRMYVNVGGGVASVGSSHNKTLLNEGLSFQLKPHNWPRKGTLILFADKGVPVVHLLRINKLARDHGLPVAPDFQPQPGQGEIFVRDMYRWPLAAAFLVVYCLACVLILAPEIRRGLFDRLGRSSAVAPLVLLVCLVSGPVSAAQWRAIAPVRGGEKVCLQSAGQRFTYRALDANRPVEFEVDGPCRIKLIHRYVLAGDEQGDLGFSISVGLDGKGILEKTFTAGPSDGFTTCADDDQVTSLRRAYVDVPRGRHTLAVSGTAAGEGVIVGRVFRQNKRRKSGTVAFAPAGYAELTTLQFESGKQSTYYRFRSDAPLSFTVNGPTNLQLYTRLDFAPGTLGSRKYMLEVWCDGELWQTFHFDTTKLANAFYPDRPDLLPGVRKKLRIDVADGLHEIEIRCVRPGDCGIAAQIRIPEADLEGRP